MISKNKECSFVIFENGMPMPIEKAYNNGSIEFKILLVICSQ